jgi:two-component system LytT family response regulator
MTAIRVMVVDDEQGARARLEDLIAREPGARLVGSYADPVEAADALRAGAADLVFLDVQMPELSGFDVVARVGPERMPAVVFVTAHDRHALHAFDVAALDYLLKPYDDERFRGVAGARACRAAPRRRGRPRAASSGGARRGRHAARSGREHGPRPTGLSRRARRIRAPGALRGRSARAAAGHRRRERRLHRGGRALRAAVRGRPIVPDPRTHARAGAPARPRPLLPHPPVDHRQPGRVASLEPLFHGDHVVRLHDRTPLRLSRERRGELGRRLGIDV